MRKTFFMFIFILLVTTSAFGKVFDVITSKGLFWVTYFYDGQYQGQKRANWEVDPKDGNGGKTWTPEREHWECLNYIISLLRPNSGDTYVIGITRPGNPWDMPWDTVLYTFVIEFTSTTQYKYWFIRI